MKTKFAVEKSEYALLIKELMSEPMYMTEQTPILQKLATLESKIKDAGDELIFIVTTKNTNPMDDKCAPPMKREDMPNA